jgi:hypothetical protein
MMVHGKPFLRTALVYDFDGTLAPGNIQEHSLIPDHLGLAPDDFWKLVKDQMKAEDADPGGWAKGELQSKAYNLIAEDRAHFDLPADDRERSQLDVTIKGVLGRIARDEAGYREQRTNGL